MERLRLLLGFAIRAPGLRFEVQLYGDDEGHNPLQPVRLERFEGAWPDSLADRRRAVVPQPVAAEDDLEAAAQPGAATGDLEPVAQPGAPMDEPRRVPGVRATSPAERLWLADQAGERSACAFWYRSLQGPVAVPPPVPHPVGDGGAPLELAWWAVSVGRGSELPYSIYDEWGGGAAAEVDEDLGEAAWRGFATETEAVSYLRAFNCHLDYLDMMVERAAELEAELTAPRRRARAASRMTLSEGLMARLIAGVTDSEMEAM